MEINCEELASWLAEAKTFHLLDVREPYEVQQGCAVNAQLIPMGSIPQRLGELPEKETPLVVYCAHGVRSYRVTAFLREQGWTQSVSLAGGFGAYLAAGGEASRP